jgi:chromosome segregation ATPase
LTRVQALLEQREDDLKEVQSILEGLEEESKRRGEVDTTTRFSLQLEVDRLKRDLERVEEELSRTRSSLNERETKLSEKDSVIDTLHAQTRDLSSQLSSQTQARLNISEKLDSVQGELKKREQECEGLRGRVGELEKRLEKDQRSLVSAEGTYRDQLTERNTLLLTIYQYLDKILGVDKVQVCFSLPFLLDSRSSSDSVFFYLILSRCVQKKGSSGETKPYTNFSVFHDNLITRLKALSQIQLDFDKKCKEVEGKYLDKLNEIKKQLDARWKQIDKFESSVKTYADVKAGWRRKYAAKEGELEGLKVRSSFFFCSLRFG